MSEKGQKLILDDRKQLSISGINNVDSFGEQQIILSSVFGGMDILGSGLKISGLDLTAGSILITGEIESISYCRSREEKSMRRKSRNALARLLK
ncbi:MAG: sporulation protein YabP [Bacillota bacterium]|nr:sporulation protein YabP [Bacillota bacterium]